MEFKDYYDILGVKEDADQAAIKKAYRKLARKYHPDVSKEADAEAKFKEVSEAFEALGNKERRAEYDQLHKYGGRGGSFTPPPGWQGRRGGAGPEFDSGQFSDFFSSIFGGGFGDGGDFESARGGAGFAARGQDIETDLALFLEETLKDEQKTISFSLPGTGADGRATQKQKTLKVKIPKGVSDGERIRLKGQGGPGFGKGPAGDLYLRIKFAPHPLFDVVGHDLHLTLPVTPWEAALGAQVTVPTLQGKVTLTVQPDSQSGQRLRLKGKGLPKRIGQGDLYVILKVVMPETSNDETRDLWRQLQEQAGFDPRKDLKRQSS